MKGFSHTQGFSFGHGFFDNLACDYLGLLNYLPLYLEFNMVPYIPAYSATPCIIRVKI